MRGVFAAAARERVVTGRAPLISLLRRQLLPREKPCVSKNLPLGDRLPRYGGGGACARGGAVARRAGGREPRLCPKPSCLREALSPTACGRSPLPEGAKEFFDNLRQRDRRGGPFVIGAAMERYRKTPTPPTGVGCPLGVLIQVVLGVVFRQSTTASKPLTRRPAIIGSACAGLNCRVNARKSPTL